MPETCKRCGRPLESPKSIEVGLGPTCKRKQDEADAEFEKLQITIFEYAEYAEKAALR